MSMKIRKPNDTGCRIPKGGLFLCNSLRNIIFVELTKIYSGYTIILEKVDTYIRDVIRKEEKI